MASISAAALVSNAEDSDANANKLVVHILHNADARNLQQAAQLSKQVHQSAYKLLLSEQARSPELSCP